MTVARQQDPTASKLRARLLLSAALVALPGATLAQFQQYTPPDELEERRESMDERLDRAMQESRWRLGRFFFDPWVSLHDVAYLENVGGRSGEEEGSDFKATVGLGVRGYRPIGREVTLAVHALPEYVWWRDLGERRDLNGRYGAGLFGDLGRTGVAVLATRDETSAFFSRELEEPVTVRSEVGSAEVELELVGGLALFAGGSVRRYRFPVDKDTPAEVALLERDEEILRAGLRFALFGALEVGLGVEDSTVDFGATQRERSNSGLSPLVEVDFEGSRVALSAQFAARDLEPEGSSVFPAYTAVTGSLRISSQPTGRTQFQLSADRNLVYALDSRWAYFEDTYYSVAVATSLGSAASLRLIGGRGNDEYTVLDPGAGARGDDFDTLGADVRIRLGRVEFGLGVWRTDYDSNLPAFDRTITVLRSGITLGRGGRSPWG